MSDAPQHSTVLDVGAEQVGKVYARALLGAARAEGSVDQVMRDLDDICDLAILPNPSLAAALVSARIDVDEKARVIDRLFGSAHPTLLRFIKVMSRRGRLGYLTAVRDQAVQLHDEFAGRVVAEVRTAVPMTPVLRTEITGQLSARLGREVRLREVVDESLIGGMIVRVGDTVFDSSVASRLNRIGKSAAAGFARKLIEHSERFSSPG